MLFHGGRVARGLGLALGARVRVGRVLAGRNFHRKQSATSGNKVLAGYACGRGGFRMAGGVAHPNAPRGAIDATCPGFRAEGSAGVRGWGTGRGPAIVGGRELRVLLGDAPRGSWGPFDLSAQGDDGVWEACVRRGVGDGGEGDAPRRAPALGSRFRGNDGHIGGREWRRGTARAAGVGVGALRQAQGERRGESGAGERRGCDEETETPLAGTSGFRPSPERRGGGGGRWGWEWGTGTPRAAHLPWVPAFAGTTVLVGGNCECCWGVGVGALRRAQGERGFGEWRAGNGGCVRWPWGAGAGWGCGWLGFWVMVGWWFWRSRGGVRGGRSWVFLGVSFFWSEMG